METPECTSDIPMITLTHTYLHTRSRPFMISYDFTSEDMVKLFQHEGKILRFHTNFAKPKPEVTCYDIFAVAHVGRFFPHHQGTSRTLLVQDPDTKGASLSTLYIAGGLSQSKYMSSLETRFLQSFLLWCLDFMFATYPISFSH